MKVCNYCGTSMEDQTIKCPFCGQDMTLKGAVKATGSQKTNAEKRFEEMTSDSFSSNLKEKLSNFLNESKKKNEETRSSSNLNVDKNHTQKKPIVADDIKAAKENAKKTKPASTFTPKNPTTPAQKKKSNGIGAMIFIFACIAFGFGFFNGYNDISFDETEKYVGTEYFKIGAYDEDSLVYTNDYMGIKYAVPKGYENTYFYDEEPYTYVDEFEAYTDDYTSKISIIYINKDFYSYSTAAQMVDYEKSYQNDTADEYEFVENAEYELDGNSYTGFIYKTIAKSSFTGSYDQTKFYLVSDYNEYYFTIIELTTEDSVDDFTTMLKGFN